MQFVSSLSQILEIQETITPASVDDTHDYLMHHLLHFLYLIKKFKHSISTCRYLQLHLTIFIACTDCNIINSILLHGLFNRP